MYRNITLQDLVQWTGAYVPQGSTLSAKVTAISTDTRTLKKGEVFAAIKGENFDGHDYLVKAAELGAAALISENQVDVRCPVILVDNPLNALVKIGQGLRNRFKGPVFAVTGSAGKSSTRDMIAELLGPNTLKAPASFNNLLGVSKTLFLLEESHEKLVLEMGMNALGEIKDMCEAFRPTLGLITNIGDAHIGKLGGKEGIYNAKKELFDYLAKTSDTLGVALNIDDPMIERAYRASGAAKLKTISYSSESGKADVRVLSKSLDPASCYLKLKIDVQGSIKEASCAIFGLHHAQNIAAAIAAARLIDIPIDVIFSRLSAIRPADHRGHILALADGVTCIDESYNSNPSALKSSLASLANVDAKRSRFIVIGEMRELGEFSKDLHTDCGKFLSSSHLKLPFRLLTVGDGAKPLGEAVKKSHSDVFHAPDQKEALQTVKENLKSNDVLFVKGSHGVRLDLLVDNLTQIVTKS